MYLFNGYVTRRDFYKPTNDAEAMELFEIWSKHLRPKQVNEVVLYCKDRRMLRRLYHDLRI